MKVENEILNEKHELQKTLNNFWSLESIGISQEEYKNDDQGFCPKNDAEVLQNFNSEVNINTEGRYEVKLPFKTKHEQLHDNYQTSKHRLRTLSKKFKNDPKLLKAYNEIIDEQVNLNIIEKVPESSTAKNVHYLPHRPVVREDRVTTKMRMVFDASSKKEGPSLNECLHPGPSLSTALYDTLIKFRENNIAIIADIEKAFLQISLHPEHRDFVRFIWFDDPFNIDYENFDNNLLVEYRFTRVLFGVTSSPFLLSVTLIKHINSFIKIDPKFVEKILASIHVDDLNSSFNNIDESFLFYKKSKERLSFAKLNLRKFQSNSTELENMVHADYSENFKFHPGGENKVLGVSWNKHKDVFTFDLQLFSHVFGKNPTKREVIQATASIFDPLGLINPVVVKLKILFQDVCLSKLGWDDFLTDKLLEQWTKIADEFKTARQIIIDRNYCFYDVNDPFVSVQLHGFSDASLRAYGCCVYLRFERKSGNSHVTLVTSKSKIAPMKKETIPRLELLGALLLSRLLLAVKKALSPDYTIHDTFAWIDSTVVLCWIRNINKVYKVFVQNRLNEIRSALDITCWKLINTKNNAADLVSRGLFASEIYCNKLWFHGPEFLKMSSHSWPNLQAGENFKESIDTEERIVQSRRNLHNPHVTPIIQASENLQKGHVMPIIQASDDLMNQINPHLTPIIQASENLQKGHVMPIIQASDDLMNEINPHVTPIIQASENLQKGHIMPIIQASDDLMNEINPHVTPIIQASENLQKGHVMPIIQASDDLVNAMNPHVTPIIQASENLPTNHVTPIIQASDNNLEKGNVTPIIQAIENSKKTHAMPIIQASENLVTDKNDSHHHRSFCHKL